MAVVLVYLDTGLTFIGKLEYSSDETGTKIFLNESMSVNYDGDTGKVTISPIMFPFNTEPEMIDLVGRNPVLLREADHRLVGVYDTAISKLKSGVEITNEHVH